MSARTGFLEESPGVFSVTRLIMLIIAVCCLVPAVWALCWYLVHAQAPDRYAIGAMGVVITGLLAGGVWHAKLRDGGDNTGAPDPVTPGTPS